MIDLDALMEQDAELRAGLVGDAAVEFYDTSDVNLDDLLPIDDQASSSDVGK